MADGDTSPSQSFTTGGLRSLSPLLRKAATDAGFDLEPEREEGWWRLRASGAPGVAWVRPLSAGRALLALSTAAQLAALDAPTLDVARRDGAALPLGAAGCVECAGPEWLYRWLRRTWLTRAASPKRLRERWQSEVAAALAAAGLPSGAPTELSPAALATTPLITEALAQVRRRVGQDLFREALLGFWEGRCAVTGLALPELLRASHAKPWAIATDAERLDVHNGLLLAVHLDALFDRGLLTFDATGRGILSPQLSNDARALLGVSAGVLQLSRIIPAQLPYLEWHGANVFRT